MPGTTVAATLIAPVVVLSVIPLCQVPDVAMVEFAAVAVAPFTVSLLRTFAIAVDAAPAADGSALGHSGNRYRDRLRRLRG